MKGSSIDWWLVVPMLLLLLFGLTLLRSVAAGEVTQQAIIMLVGLIIFFLLTFTDYRLFGNLHWGIYGIVVLLLLTTLIIGQTTRGAIRWIPLGSLRLQTSEIAKPLLTLFFASVAGAKRPHNFKNIIWLTVLFLIPALLIFRQPDLGSTLVVTALWLGIVFAAGLPPRYLIGGIILASILLPLGWATLQDYQQARLLTFIDPLSDPLQSGYNLLQSIIAVGSGQLLGRGLGQGTQSQLRFLPERHTDFIFASLSEELGFLGACLFLGLCTVLLIRVLKTAKTAPDSFGALVCFGVFSQLAFQIFVNVGMNIGLVPITGITLPLISVGGSSILSTLISLGFVSSIASRRKTQELFEIR